MLRTMARPSRSILRTMALVLIASRIGQPHTGAQYKRHDSCPKDNYADHVQSLIGQAGAPLARPCVNVSYTMQQRKRYVYEQLAHAPSPAWPANP